LLSPEMEAWQGPSLLVHNNSTFKEKDFESIVSIGQGQKLDELLSTGRFGLGFNRYANSNIFLLCNAGG
jgi:sacsin